MSRRLVLGGSAAVAGAGLTGLGATAAWAEPPAATRAGTRTAVRRAVTFLQQVVDAYRPSGPRIAQSYYDGSGLTDLGFTYDNALAIIALLAGGDVTRARAIGDAFVYAQNHDPDPQVTDGRLRQTYHADQFTVSAGGAVRPGGEIGLDGTAVGDMAWAGIALAQLAQRTRSAAYREGAVRIAEWIQTNRSTSGLGGYTFGTSLPDHKSTEHNIDVYAFFRMLAQLTGQRVWRDRAEHAWAFVRGVWNAADGFFWTGSDDGSTINKKASQLPLDAQTWSWLAARDRRYARALDWGAGNLASTDTPLRTNSELSGNYTVTGVAFGSGSVAADTGQPIDPYHGNPDSGAVWFEGTAQLALARADRGARGDAAAADALLAAVVSAQQELGEGQTFNRKPTSGGIVAASSPLQTGYGFGYYQHLHVGASSWFVFAGTGTNPYRLG